MALLGSVMLSGITVGDAAAQSLAERIASAPAGHVQFTFAARPGICGNGRSYIQTGPGSFTGTFYGSVNDVARAEPCEPGPVRVLIDRSGRDVIALQSFVGPVATTPGATDLGRQSGQAAADYLLRQCMWRSPSSAVRCGCWCWAPR